jgi:hypothetical protein
MPQPNKGDLLIAELIAAGGRIVVQREYRAGGPNWPARIASAARSKQLPADKYIAYGWCQGGIEIVLKDIPAWRTEALAPIAVSERLTNPLPAVTSVRDGNRPLPLTKAALPRALRLLQALFTECERRGYKVKLIPDGRPQYKQGRLQLTDQFTVQPPEVTVGVAVSQQNDRVEHVPTAAELAQSAKNSWVKIPRYDYVPSTRLSIRLTGGQVHRQMEWSDSKDAALDDVLPQMVQEMELRSAAAVAKRKADEEAATLKRQRWEAAVAQARLAYREAFRAKALRQDRRLAEGAGSQRVPQPCGRRRDRIGVRRGPQRCRGMARMDRRLCRAVGPAGGTVAHAAHSRAAPEGPRAAPGRLESIRPLIS